MNSLSVKSQRSELDHRQLLINLKKSVELWCLVRRDCSKESINTTEAIIQIQLSIKSILNDGLLLHGNVNNYRKLVTDLNWLNSSDAITSQQSESYVITTPLEKLPDDLSLWISFCLKNGGLCESLQHFVTDQELLESYYTDGAFLRNEKYATALFICLSAFELNQSSLISQIDSSLYTENIDRTKHKRSSSHPHFSISPKKYSLCKSAMSKSAKFMHENSSESLNKFGTDGTHLTSSKIHKSTTYRRSKSMPIITQYRFNTRQRSKTISQPISIPGNDTRYHLVQSFEEANHQKVPNFVYGQFGSEPSETNIEASSSGRSPDLTDLIPIQLVKCDDIKIYFDQTQTPSELNYRSSLSEGTTINYDSPPESRIVSSINLLSCISSNNMFSPPSYENLSKEQNILHSAFSTSAPSDFVSAFLPQDGEKLKSRFSKNLFEDVGEQVLDTNVSRASTPLASQSLTSFLQSASFSRNNTDLERENAHFKISEAIISIIEQIKFTKIEQNKLEIDPCTEVIRHEGKEDLLHSGPHAKRSSSKLETQQNLQSENLDYKSSQNINDYVAYAEWGENNLDALSAEGVALSLISKFRDRQLPRASDITWLVSEEDAPQKLLPMPTNISSDPDDNFVHSFTRGTRDWAPPRQQVIFTDHPFPNRKAQMQKQNYRCAGCGMRVADLYINRYRYCTYFGKYQCSGCHRNQISLIPAKVLEKWDFTYYPVSVFAYRLLEQIWTYPLFYIPDLNPSLYTKIKSLHMAKLRRIQLKYIQDFIKTCRFAEKEKQFFESIPSYWCSDCDKWAMSDFVAAKNGSFQKNLTNLIERCEEHVFNCVLCTARGFICELCPRKQIIYPWQPKIKRCENCGSCFHQSCWKDIPACVKCQRLRIREQRIL